VVRGHGDEQRISASLTLSLRHSEHSAGAAMAGGSPTNRVNQSADRSSTLILICSVNKNLI